MQSKTNTQITLATISSLERVLKVMSHETKSLMFHSECPWQPPTLPFALFLRRRVHLQRHLGVLDQLSKPNPRQSHQIRMIQTIQSPSVKRLLGGSNLHPSGVGEGKALLHLAALLDHNVDGGDTLKVMSPIRSPTSATASLNLRTMTRSRHLRALNPIRYIP